MCRSEKYPMTANKIVVNLFVAPHSCKHVLRTRTAGDVGPYYLVSLKT